MTLGRKLRIDGGLNKSGAARCVFPLIFTFYFVLFTAGAAFSAEGLSLNGFLTNCGVWIAAVVVVDCWIQSTLAFEIQLLPGAVRIKKWWCDELLIEPEVVGGRIGWLNRIQLRAGERSASIRLGTFSSRHTQAAIIEHCSQFLSTEQQAAYGSDWAKRYHRLLSPRKPTCPLRFVRIIFVTYAICLLALITITESMVAFGSPEALSAHERRWAYSAWLVATVLCCLLGLLMIRTKRVTQQKLTPT